MNGHLTAEQVARTLLGDGTAAEKQHAGECADCRADLARMQETLTLFRGAVREWADGNSSPGVPESRSAAVFTAPRGRTSRWILAAAAILILVMIPIGRNIREAEVRDAEMEAEMKDTMLLEQVNAHLVRTVPSSMEPFVELLPDLAVADGRAVDKSAAGESNNGGPR